ncbi:MAG TPA: hypothetical protein VLB68_04095 [Pyrinomonadaceae bacterium]|nr:hypothetical protein [Pyrinomonadaceae bacterium]
MDFQGERFWTIRYAVLTALIFLPLLWSFRYIRNLYPIAAWDVMMAGGNLERGRTYFILRGETLSGEVVDLPPIKLTNGMSGRTWTMVNATVDNQSFKLSKLEPQNEALLRSVGGLPNLPVAARLPDLLQAWGALYNERLEPDAPTRLRAVRLDMYRWSSGTYSGYETYVESWRKEL